MGGRQARIARKAAQRNGLDVFTHMKPTRRSLLPVPVLPADPRAATKVERTSRQSGRGLARRRRLYGDAA